MKKTETKVVKYVKLGTTALIAFICLVIGFLGGNIYSVYKGGESSGFNPPSSYVNPPSNQTKMINTDQIKTLKEAVTKDPENTLAWNELGNLYFDSGKFDEAIHAYNEYLKRNPNNANVLTDLGIMYRRKNQSKMALDAFNKAIAIDPSHQHSRFNKGIVYLHDLNNPEEAKKAWIELEKINPAFSAPNGQSLKKLLSSFK